MYFDVIAMKQRAKQLMRMTKPNPLLAGLVVTVFNLIMVIIMSCVGNMKGYVPVIIFLFLSCAVYPESKKLAVTVSLLRSKGSYPPFDKEPSAL